MFVGSGSVAIEYHNRGRKAVESVWNDSILYSICLFLHWPHRARWRQAFSTRGSRMDGFAGLATRRHRHDHHPFFTGFDHSWCRFCFHLFSSIGFASALAVTCKVQARPCALPCSLSPIPDFSTNSSARVLQKETARTAVLK